MEPLKFGLQHIYPNPFNPSTTIRCALATDGPVILEIYNILGQRVRTLVDNQNLPAGVYEVLWNGNNEQGVPVGSGAYLVTLRSESISDSRKVIMLK